MIVDRLNNARNFNDSFFNPGEPNLVLVPSGKIYYTLTSHITSDTPIHII